ncbi:MAG: nucleotidyltransferase domain-containing protein, partial [Desulfuromonadales bacterium]|nr:nucleotidyltransferase domain-containing protein [Desulfuromonadales bacterium]
LMTERCNLKRCAMSGQSDIKRHLIDFFAEQPGVKFAYLFGSEASGATGPLSDLDLAVCLDGRLNLFKEHLRLSEALAKALKSEQFDLVVLNSATLVLKHEVIKNGIVLKEDRSRRILFETQVLQEYLDTSYLRNVHYQYMRQQIEEDRYFG